jgi:hypothetical protein
MERCVIQVLSTEPFTSPFGGPMDFSAGEEFEMRLVQNEKTLATQGFGSLTDYIEITGICEDAVPPLSRDFFNNSDSHQVIEGHCNCGNREFERFGRGGDVCNRFRLHVFVDPQS